MPRLHVAIGLLSTALIAFQLVLMQILSIVQWYHFAYMVISVALLGFGASGTLIALARRWLLARLAWVVPLSMIGSGAAMAVVVGLSQRPPFRFDSYLLFVDTAQIGALSLSYLLFFVPFFLGALAIGLTFVRYTEQIGTFYFANLLGSGLGGLVAVALLWHVSPPLLPPVTALLPLAAGLILASGRWRTRLLVAATAGLALVLFALVRPPALVLSEYKSLSRTLDLPEAEIALERASPYGLVQVVSAPALRHAPGLSLTYARDIPTQAAVFNNGNWFGPVTAWSRRDTTHLLDYTTAALPFAVRPRDAVLVLNAGTGEALAHALSRGARHVAAVEPHRAVLSLFQHELAAATDSLFYHPSVTTYPLEPRTYLAAGDTRYDLIILPTVGAFGGTVGLSALQEQYTLTKAAFREMWHRLTPEGAVSVTTWMDYPFRTPLKLLATLVEALEEAGVARPHDHLAAVRSWGTLTVLLSRSPLTADETRRVRRFCDRLLFDPAVLPDLLPGERTHYNQMQDEQFFAYVDQILSPGRRALYDTYDFYLKPATDQRPYFSQFLRWQSLPRLAALFGEQTASFLEIGYLILGVTLIQIAVAALLLIILPLFRIGWRGRGRGWTLLYFGGLGLGYLFVEIVLIQRFTLYLGHPIYATAAVIGALLICSGAGSYVSARFTTRCAVLWKAAGLVALLIALYAVLLTPLLRASIAFPLWLKALCALLLIAPPAFAMGFPFPLGLRHLGHLSGAQVPWAWGINGCLSVVSTALATLLAVEAGFVAVLLAAAGAYALVAAASTRCP